MDAAILYPQIGTKEDSANASGSLHAKVGHLDNAIGVISAKNIINYGSAVKSIQRGTGILQTTNNEVTVTISSVNVNKAMINFLGASAATFPQITYYAEKPVAYAETGHHFVRLSLTNATTITANRQSNQNVATTFNYEVIEFY